MKISKLLNLSAIALVFWFVPIIGVALASPITYTLTGTGSGTVNGAPFTNSVWTITVKGDTLAITYHASITEYDLLGTTVTMAITGVGTATVTDSVSIFSSQVGSEGRLGISRNGAINGPMLILSDAAFITYALATPLGPITAFPSLYSRFQNLQTNLGPITLSSSGSVTFQAVLGSPTLIVSKSGTGTGTVTSSPAGINCGSTCSALYKQGTQITLRAKADPGSTFTGWSGGCTGTTPSCKLTMTSNEAVTAAFVLPDLHGELSGISVSVSKSTYQISGALTVYSDGAKTSGVKANVYLSDEETLGQDPLPLGSITMGSIKAGSSVSKTLKFNGPTDPWGRYVIAVINAGNVIKESDYTNNIVASYCHPKITSFALDPPDVTLSYPGGLVDLPDEHTTIMPLSSQPGTYLLFGSSDLYGAPTGGTTALQTTDLINFKYASALGYNHQVMTPAIAFKDCDPSWDSVFDENYAGAGSVLQDPTLPPGNFIIIYEAENHCAGGQNKGGDFYATVGFARSSDYGRTWPPPVDSEYGDATRYPVLKQTADEPQGPHPNMGDALPSAFVDTNDKGEAYLYVTYTHDANGSEPGPNGWRIRVARAKLGRVYEASDAGDDSPAVGPPAQLQFYKWYNGSFSEPGIHGFDSPVLPETGSTGNQVMGEITYNDDLRLYVMVFVGEGAWFYSTATSLDRQDWTIPQMIDNSEHYVSPGGCDPNDYDPNDPSSWPGYYPSFMTPGAAAGHTRLTGRVFFLEGCIHSTERHLASRGFTIAIEH
jgi:hypothetical protein